MKDKNCIECRSNSLSWTHYRMLVAVRPVQIVLYNRSGSNICLLFRESWGMLCLDVARIDPTWACMLPMVLLNPGNDLSFPSRNNVIIMRNLQTHNLHTEQVWIIFCLLQWSSKFSHLRHVHKKGWGGEDKIHNLTDKTHQWIQTSDVEDRIWGNNCSKLFLT